MCLPGTVEKVREQMDAEPAEEGGLTRRATLAGAGAVTLGALLPAGAAARPRGGGWGYRQPRHYEDLTHAFTAGFPVYFGNAPTRRTLVTVEADGFYSQAWTFEEHSGTHMDAPGHFVSGGRLVTALEPSELFAPVAVVDISKRASRDPDAEVELRDLRRFERRYGRVPRGAIVCMHSGWEERLSDPDAFKNADAAGVYHFPGFGLEAVEWLLERRSIAGIGVDTLSLDPGTSANFEVHQRLLGADRYGVENLANLGRIPARGVSAVVGVVPWEEGSGGPCRVLASW